jgi:phage protein D
MAMQNKQTNPKFLVDRRAQTLRPIVTKARTKQNKTKTKTKKIQNEAMHSPRKPEFLCGKEAKPLRVHFLNRRRISSRCKTRAAASATAKRERESASEREERKTGRAESTATACRRQGAINPSRLTSLFHAFTDEVFGKLNLPLLVSW